MAFGHQGVDVYHLLAGLGVGMAVSVGAMAGQGWTADPGTLENFFAPRASAQGEFVDWAPFLAEPVHYSVLENYFKRYPACAHTMSSIDAAAKLAEEQRPPVREIEFIEIRCGVEAAAELNSVDPPNLFGGRYSIPFLSAVALVRGRSEVIALDAASLRDDEVRRLSGATVVRHDPALAREYSGGRPAAIKVTLRDGTSLESVVPTPTGESANPMDRAELDQKALALLGSRYGDTAGSLLDQLRDGVAGDRPVAELSQLLRQPV
jgi:2-methylcitrate dehydratase PrpD